VPQSDQLHDIAAFAIRSAFGAAGMLMIAVRSANGWLAHRRAETELAS
jgi:hypothetical protein